MLNRVVLVVATISTLASCGTPRSLMVTKSGEGLVRERDAKQASSASSESFVLELTQRLEINPSLCDEGAIADRTTDWTCAGYLNGPEEFVRLWETLANSSEFVDRYSLLPISDWMYFIENEKVDFYARTYELKNNQVVVAYDPSEKGREIFIGMSPNAVRIMSAATGPVILDESVASLSKETKLKDSYTCAEFTSFASASYFFKKNGFGVANDPYGLDANGNGIPCEKNEPEIVAQQSISSRNSTLKGSYNCTDFATTALAQQFFDDRGFSSTYDPYSLDADNNGIPCENPGSVVSDSSKCPTGESWVSPYTRSNGSNVRGHCRKRR